ncbi:MAG: hypothetical protein ACJAU1_001713 [Psychromonas sp.]|jgi:hypothetical protein
MKVQDQKNLLYPNIYGFSLVLNQKIGKKAKYFSFVRIFKAVLQASGPTAIAIEPSGFDNQCL